MKSIFICFLSAFESSLHSISLQTEIAKRLNVICAQLIPFLSQEVRWDQHTLSPTATHHDTHTCHVAFRRSVIDNSLTCALTHTISLFLFLTHMQSHFFFFFLFSSHISSRFHIVSHSDASGKPIVILVNPLPQKRLRFAQSFSWPEEKQPPPPALSVCIHTKCSGVCVCVSVYTHTRKWKLHSTQRHTRVAICLVLLLVCLSLTAIFLTSFHSTSSRWSRPWSAPNRWLWGSWMRR